MEQIKLQNMPNTRDLSYIHNKDNKYLKANKIIRSGATSKASKDDISILVNDHHLKRVIDFRTIDEAHEQPDYLIDGVQYIFNPIFNSINQGITHENKPKNEMEWLSSTITSMHYQVKECMKMMYEKILTDEYATFHYQQFFHILLDEVDGSTLYHCSAGKDRVGVGTILLLSALDVDRQVIIDDYLFTNKCYQESIDKIMIDMKNLNYDDKIIEQIPYCQGVCQEYVDHIFNVIDNQYQGINNYLHHVLKLTEADLNKLKQIYLQK